MRAPLKLVEHANERMKEYTVQLDRPNNRASVLLTGAACVAACWAVVPAEVRCSTLLVALIAIGALVAAVGAACQVTSESVIVLKGVGVLLLTRQRWGGSSSRLLDLQDIHSVIINEILTTTNVHVYLTFLLHNSSELAVAFPSLSPGLKVLIPLYRELQQLVPGGAGQAAANEKISRQ